MITPEELFLLEADAYRIVGKSKSISEMKEKIAALELMKGVKKDERDQLISDFLFSEKYAPEVRKRSHHGQKRSLPPI